MWIFLFYYVTGFFEKADSVRCTQESCTMGQSKKHPACWRMLLSNGKTVVFLYIEVEFICKISVQLIDGHPLSCSMESRKRTVTVIFLGIKIVGYAERSTDFIPDGW